MGEVKRSDMWKRCKKIIIKNTFLTEYILENIIIKNTFSAVENTKQKVTA